MKKGGIHSEETRRKMQESQRRRFHAENNIQHHKVINMVFKKKTKPTFEQWSVSKEAVAQFPQTPAVIVAEFQKSHQKDLNRIRIDAMREEYEKQFGDQEEV